jgi:hypothetical protein
MTTSTVVNEASRARELLSRRIKDLYVFPKVAGLDDLIEYLERENAGRDEMLAVLTDVDERGRLRSADGVLDEYEQIMPGYKSVKHITSEVIPSKQPVYSFVRGVWKVGEFVEAYDFIDSKLARQKFKENVASRLNLYFERKQRQSKLA